MNRDTISKLLTAVALPGHDEDLVASGRISEVEIDGGEVTVVVTLDGFDREARHTIEDAIVATLDGQDGIDDVLVEVEMESMPEPPPPADDGVVIHGGGGGGGHSHGHAHGGAQVKPQKGALSDVRHIIAVASGKGGVGKSTVAVNLALALKARGAKVGLCDLDIYGPSVPTQMGVAKAKPGVSQNQKQFLPVDAYGVAVMSIGFLVDDDTPVIWRGPIVSSVVKQFLDDVEWGALDYLVIDMPPGTGDAQLTLSQTAPLTGAVIVTTPSELALIDAVKGLQMFRKVDTPVLGLVENMSHYICENCGHQSHPFNTGGAQRIAEQFKVGMLAEIPIDNAIQRGGDEGRPIMVTAADSPQGKAFDTLAEAVIEKCPFETDKNKKKGFLANLFKR